MVFEVYNEPKPVCPRCASENEPEAQACANCGAPLTTADPYSPLWPHLNPSRYTGALRMPNWLMNAILAAIALAVVVVATWVISLYPFP